MTEDKGLSSYKVGGVIMRGKDNPCYGCTEATGRAYNCHTLEKFMKRNALNRNRRGRK